MTVWPVDARSQHRWRRCVDTALASPDDIHSWELAPPIATTAYDVQPRSVVIVARELRAEE
jgi:hypothetical protein